MAKRRIRVLHIRFIIAGIILLTVGSSLAGIVSLSLSPKADWFEKSIGKEITIGINGEQYAGVLTSTSWQLCDSALGFVGYRVDIRSLQIPGEVSGIVTTSGTTRVFSPWELNRIETKEGIDFDYYRNHPGN